MTYYYVSGGMGMTPSGSFTRNRSRWMTFTADEAARIGAVGRPYGATKTGIFVPVEQA